jgi:predicted DNA-binding protein
MVRVRYPHIVSAWLPTELYIALEKYAEQTGKNKAEVIREALQEFFKARGFNIEEFRKDFRRNPGKFQRSVIIV